MNHPYEELLYLRREEESSSPPCPLVVPVTNVFVFYTKVHDNLAKLEVAVLAS
jgi:hypothetical protein